jgi:hypothetical protein
MKRLLRLLVSTAIVAIPFAVGSNASAGGWAISTLDEVPAPAPGETVMVGFTIRQHGVTPVNIEDPGLDVGVVVTGPSGGVEFFPAAQEGEVGHYVADVVFGEAGVHSWAIRQGWFSDHELGTIDTSSATGTVGGGTSMSTQFLRYGMPTLALALAGYAAIDTIGSRRRRHPVAS